MLIVCAAKATPAAVTQASMSRTHVSHGWPETVLAFSTQALHATLASSVQSTTLVVKVRSMTSQRMHALAQLN